MAKFGGLGTSFLIGAVVGAGALFVLERLKNISFGANLAPTPPVAQSHVSYANVGILPGNELPFYDYLDDSAPRGTSNVWDRRDSVYRNDRNVLYNTVGAPVFSDGTSDWDASKRLNLAGAYSGPLEDGPRPRQEHYFPGVFPEALNSPNYPY